MSLGSGPNLGDDLGDRFHNQVLDYRISKQGKVLLTLARFADKLLRKKEPRDGAASSGPPAGFTAAQYLINGGLQAIEKDDLSLAKITVQCGLQALNLGYAGASDIIPRMLDVVGKYREGVEAEFRENSKRTPAWFFLRWISQIASILNRPESSIISKIVA